MFTNMQGFTVRGQLGLIFPRNVAQLLHYNYYAGLYHPENQNALTLQYLTDMHTSLE